MLAASPSFAVARRCVSDLLPVTAQESVCLSSYSHDCIGESLALNILDRRFSGSPSSEDGLDKVNAHSSGAK